MGEMEELNFYFGIKEEWNYEYLGMKVETQEDVDGEAFEFPPESIC